MVGSNNFSAQFTQIISHYKKIGYNIYVSKQTASLVVNPITVGNFAFLFNCKPAGLASDSMTVPTDVVSVVGPTRVKLLDLFYSSMQLYVQYVLLSIFGLTLFIT